MDWKRRNKDGCRFWWDRSDGDPLGLDLPVQKSEVSLFDPRSEPQVDWYLRSVELGGRAARRFDQKGSLDERLWAAQGVFRR